jgi:hypothetical protein
MLQREITLMKVGDTVRIYPHGSPATVARATVLIASKNGLSVGVDFEEPPPFYEEDDKGFFVDRVTGRVCMLLVRRELNSVPWGRWIDVANDDRHYEIGEDLQ